MVHIGRPHTSLPYRGGGSPIVLDPDLVDIGELEAMPSTILGVNENNEWTLNPINGGWLVLLNSNDTAFIMNALGGMFIGDVDQAVDGLKTFVKKLSLLDGLDMNATKITELAAGTASTDAVNKAQLDGKLGRVVEGTTSTATGTPAKAVTSAITPVAGDIVAVTFTNGNNVSGMTLNFNGTTSYPVSFVGSNNVNVANLSLSAGATLLFYFTGAAFQMAGVNLDLRVATQAEIDSGGTGYRLLQPSLLKANLDTKQAASAILSGMAAATITSGSSLKVLATGDQGATWQTIATFGIGRSLMSAGDAAAINNLLPTAINPQTGTSYDLVLTDAQKLITMNNAAANTIRIPTNASISFPVGTVVGGMQLGAGQTSFVAITPGTTTVRSAPGPKIANQYGSAAAVKIATDEWVVYGALAA